MKKLSILLAALLTGTAVASAEDWHITVNVTGAEFIKEAFITDSYYSGTRTPVTFTEGENPITIAEKCDLYFSVTEGVISTLTNNNGSNMSVNSNGYYDIYRGWGAEDNAVYTFTAMPESEYRTASVTINMDTPERVTIERADGTTFKPAESPLVVAYNPANESKLTISPRGYGKGLYKVMAGNVEITPTKNEYIVNLAGDNTAIETIDITASYPEDFTYTAKINIDGPSEAITSVTVDGTQVEDFLSADGFSIKPETRLSFVFDTKNYAIDSFLENGKAPFMYSNEYSVSSVLCDYVYDLKVHERKNVSTTINAVCPDAFDVTIEDVKFTLVEGANPVTVKEGTNQIRIKAKTGYDILKLEYGGEDLLQTEDFKYLKEARITVEEGKEINIEGALIVRDHKIAVFFKNLELSASWSRDILFYDAKYTYPEDIVEGYNIVPFRPADGLAMVYFGGTYEVAPEAYLNDEAMTVFSGPYHLEADVVDGDVIKVFLGGSPETHDVTFNFDGDVEPADLDIRKDILAAVNPETTVKAVGKTSFAISAANDIPGLSVMVGNNAITPDQDGKFVFDIDADATVNISASSSGIESIADGADTTVNVYNLQGILVLKNADPDAIRALPAGIYIAGGKKITVR